MRTCEEGCNGCDECTDYADEHDGPPEPGIVRVDRPVRRHWRRRLKHGR